MFRLRRSQIEAIQLLGIFPIWLFGLVIFAVPNLAHANSPQAMMLQGTILTPAGLPQEAASVAFTVEVRSPGAENCLLYSEDHTLNMTNSGGAFSLPIGTGVRTGVGFQATSTVGEVFDNSAANITGLTCTTGTAYDPMSLDTRKVLITFNDGSGPQTLAQTLSVQSVPYALHSDSVGGKTLSQLLQVNSLTAALTQANLESVFTSGAAVTELLALIAGTSTLYQNTTAAQTYTGTLTLDAAGTGLTVTNNASIGGTASIGGVTTVTNATASTSSSTGAVVVTGGLGVGGAINAGTTMSAGTSLMTPIIYGSSAASGTLTLQSTSNATKGNILINPNGGNVGIGTASPSAKLNVLGSSFFQDINVNNPSDSALVLVGGTAQFSNYASDYSGIYLSNLFLESGGSLSGEISGLYSAPTLGVSSGSVTSFSGVRSLPRITSNTTTISSAAAFKGGVSYTGPGTLSNAYSLLALSNLRTIGTLTNNYGIYIESQSVGTTNYQLYSAGSAPSYFAGNVGIGTTTPGANLAVSSISTAASATAQSVIMDSTPSVANGTIRSLYIENDVSGTTAKSAIKGIDMYVGNNVSSGTVSNMLGADLSVYAETGVVNLYGIRAKTEANAAGSTLNVGGEFTAGGGAGAGGLVGVRATADRYNAGSLAVGIEATANNDSAIGGTAYGGRFQVTGAYAVTTGYGVYIDDVNATTGYGIYSAGSNDRNYFAGNVGIGTTTPTSPLAISKTTTATTGSEAGLNTNVTHTPVGGVIGSEIVGSSASVTHTGTSPSAVLVGQKGIVVGNSTGNSSTLFGGQFTATKSNTGGTISGYGVYGQSENQSSNGMTEANGVYGLATNTSTGWILTAIGGKFDVTNTNAGGFITGATGGSFSVTNSAGTITNAYGVRIGTVQGTNKWSLYSNDATAPSYFAGNIGIGVTGPTSKLQVAGDITPDTTATNSLGSGALRWNNIYLSNAPDVSSDARLKKDVKTSDLGLDFVNSLRPVSWVWKDPNQGSTRHYGVIAQEAESAIAKAKADANAIAKGQSEENDSSNVIVTHNEETDSYSVRYTELISPLIKAVQELYAKVIGQDEKIQAQDREIASVKAENEKLKQENAAMKERLDKIEAMLNSK